MEKRMQHNIVPPAIIESITRLVSYVSKETVADFMTDSRQREHIYQHAKRVREWLERLRKPKASHRTQNGRGDHS